MSVDLSRPLITRDELAELFQMPRHYFDDALRAGNAPPCLRIGRSIRYDRRQVEEWLAKQIYIPPGKRNQDI